MLMQARPPGGAPPGPGRTAECAPHKIGVGIRRGADSFSASARVPLPAPRAFKEEILAEVPNEFDLRDASSQPCTADLPSTGRSAFVKSTLRCTKNKEGVSVGFEWLHLGKR